MRPGEVLNLRRGCRATDPNTGELLLLGRRVKGADRTPHPGAGPASDEQARPWTVVQPVHDAVALLEHLTPHPLLFPPGYGRTPPRDPATSARSSIGIARDIHALLDWVKRTFAPADGTTPIPPDPAKNLHASRFRRTLAYFIVRRPRGVITAALQYGHIATKLLSDIRDADPSWMDDLAVERLEHAVAQIGRDLDLLERGEHVSGPAAAEYRARIERAAPSQAGSSPASATPNVSWPAPTPTSITARA
ncbi:hypothetical protein E1265_18045 [Streptomyces sp. 8K308]|uniref:hypothetical protein n=1 Tax=Streptomyces sp. 8K308 TaxID=2530388 RepID=UPI00104FE1E0|nr:hypothetical protein [Streptomyces sp. 8K308]TDC21435.1 hypothetical protein E1265_18045 [Streptomyces sp. 8K308]